MYLTNSGTKLHNFDPIFYWRLTMLLFDKLYAFIMNHFLPKEEFDPDKVTCSIDNITVSCETWEETK